MQQNQIQYQPYPLADVKDDEIDIRELFLALWLKKWVIMTITVVFAIGAVIFAVKQPNTYKADTLLVPAESSSGGGLSKMAGQLGGLAALAGVNIADAEASQTMLAIEVMQSRKFIEDFIKKHNLLVPLMASKGWNLNSNQLIFNNDIYDVKADKWLRKPNGLRGVEPTEQEAYKLFISRVLNIVQDKDSGLYTVSITHYSPYIAMQWTKWIVEDINSVMRQRTIAETTQNLAYLNLQLQKTSVTDMKSTFYQLIEEQTKSLMLAEVQDEFVFKTLDPAVVPELKNGPNRAIISIIGTLIGFVLSVLLVLTLYLIKLGRNTRD